MIAIRTEIRAIEKGESDPESNALKGAPHTAAMLASDQWDRHYSREQAAFPLPWVRERVPAIMASVAQLKVPLVAEVGIGSNWDQAH